MFRAEVKGLGERCQPKKETSDRDACERIKKGEDAHLQNSARKHLNIAAGCL
jgi:hypothetical protein